MEDYDDYTFVVPGAVEKGADMLNELLPTSHMSDLWHEALSANTETLLEPVWYSLIFSAAVTAVGVLAFRKKDLK